MFIGISMSPQLPHTLLAMYKCALCDIAPLKSVLIILPLGDIVNQTVSADRRVAVKYHALRMKDLLSASGTKLILNKERSFLPSYFRPPSFVPRLTHCFYCGNVKENYVLRRCCNGGKKNS